MYRIVIPIEDNREQYEQVVTFASRVALFVTDQPVAIRHAVLVETSSPNVQAVLRELVANSLPSAGLAELPADAEEPVAAPSRKRTKKTEPQPAEPVIEPSVPTCAHCRKPFTPRRHDQRFCSPDCKKAWVRFQHSRPWRVGGEAYAPSEFHDKLKAGTWSAGTEVEHAELGAYVVSNVGYKFTLARPAQDPGGFAPVSTDQAAA